jgi:hypothetical protein
MDFGHRNFHFENDMTSCTCTLINDHDLDLRLHVVKFGLNYRFGAAPVAAPVAARY